MLIIYFNSVSKGSKVSTVSKEVATKSSTSDASKDQATPVSAKMRKFKNTIKLLAFKLVACQM